MRQYQPSRRAILQRGLLLGLGGWAAALTGCSSPDNAPAAASPTTSPTATPTPTSGGATTANRTLLAYFSRPGENYYYYGGRRNLGARIGDGLAVRGEEVTQHRTELQTWVRDAGLDTA